MQRIDFSYNWNKKLDCNAFTTLRLSPRFQVGEEVEVFLNSARRAGRYRIAGKKELKLDTLNDYHAYVDTGYNAEECKNILRKMYKNKVQDWNAQPIYFYLIVKFKTPKQDEPKLFNS